MNIEENAKELILAIIEKTLKSLKDKGLLKEPSKLQMLCSIPEMKTLIKKLSDPKYDPCCKFNSCASWTQRSTDNENPKN